MQKMFYAIEGSVTRANAVPLEGVVVVIVQGTASYPEIAALTNEKGQFSLGDLEAGTYTVRATFQGQQQEQQVVVRDSRQSLHFVF